MKSLTPIEENYLNHKFFNDRWPEVRSWNLKKVKKLWDEEPNRVQVVNDPRLGETSLVMMRKEQFETLQNIIRDLLDGQAGIESNLDLIFHQVKLIEEVMPKEGQGPLKSAITVLKGLARSSSRIFIAEPSPLSPSQPTPEELEGYNEDEDL